MFFFVAFTVAMSAQTPTLPTGAVLESTVEPTRLVILDLAANGVDATLVQTISEGLAVTLSNRRIVSDVVTAADLRTLLSLEAEKQAFGAPCADAEACMAEVAQGLGAEFLLHGSVGRYGDIYQVSISIFDARTNRTIAREKCESAKVEALSRKVEHAATRLALAYQGKSPDLAGAAPDDAAGHQVLMWSGVGLGATGLLMAVAMGSLAATNAAVIEDPASSGVDKSAALNAHGTQLAAAIGGGAIAALGASTAVAALVWE